LSDLYLIDASSYIHRAYHALPPLATREGVPTNAVYGFATMVQKLIRERKPDYLGVVMDSATPTFRKQAYEAYKANRPPADEDLVSQFPLVEEVVRGFSLPALRVDGYEADDIIADLVRRFGGEVDRVVIVSGDKDLMQLVSGKVAMLDAVRDRRIGPAEVRKRLGVNPAQVADYLALRGDPGDNIPGVRGIGEKTAVRLLAEYGDLDTLLARAGEVKGKTGELLRAGEKNARLSRELVALDHQVPLEVLLPDLALRPPDPELLRPVFVRLEFTRLLRELESASADTGESPAIQGQAPRSTLRPLDRLGAQGQPPVAVDRSAYRCILDEKELAEVAKELARVDVLAFDTETDSLDAVRANLAGISLAWREGETFKACYIPLAHAYLGAPRQIPAERARDLLAPVLADPRIRKVAQNAKYDLLVLARAGWRVGGLWCDPMIASWLLDPGRRAHGLDAMAAERLGHAMLTYDSVTKKGKTRIPFPEVPVEEATAYSAEDADVTLRLAGPLLDELEAQGLTKLYRELEMPLVPVLVDMEQTGVLVDAKRLDRLSAALAQRMAELEDSIHREAGRPFTVNSPQQLAAVLFEELKLPTGRKTAGRTGYSTDAEVLEELSAHHRLPALVLEYRSLAKLRNTYSDALPKLVNPGTGRVHTSYNQAATATGRLSSSDPNLQNIPIRTGLGKEIREAFVAPPGHVLLSADYSQVELRILAHLSRDQVLLDSFRAGEDVHARTAREVLGMGKRVDPELRRRAKAINFGIIYGMSAFGLARELGIPQGEARAIIEDYFEHYRGVKAWLDSTIGQARREGFVATMTGRRRPLPELSSGNQAVRQAGERMAVNTPIQGAAADILKVAMLRVHAALAAHLPRCRMLLTVHDELLFEVPEKSAKKAEKLVREAMEGAATLDIPLVVDVGTGRNWAEAH
jgi:DNA polymerase-1